MRGFGEGFWTPYTIVLVSVTVVLLGILAIAVGILLWVALSILLSWRPVKREACTDEVFGELQRESYGSDAGSWYGSAAFHHEPTRATTLMISIDAGDGQPTESQRVLFREIASRYPLMWPEIADALAANHPRLKTVELVARYVDQPYLALDQIVAGEPLTWSFQYTFDAENEDEDSFNDFCGYFVSYCDWQMIGVDVVD